MRFLELMRVAGGRGVEVREVRAVGEGAEVLGVCEDSRKVRAGDVFVARRGTTRDGGAFVAEAVSRGAVGIVMEESPGIAIPGLGSEVGLARVADANVALALLAHEVAGRPTEGMKMIGVTGTKGKTTVAYLMRAVLKAAGHRVGMVGTVEMDDGKEVVPAEMTTPGVVELVEWFSRMKANGVTHCVMEVSSHALDQHRVAGIDFAVGMFTNLTGDHLDYHGTMEAYGAAKKRLFEGLGEDATAVVNVDDAWGEKMVEGCKAKVVRYGVVDNRGEGIQHEDTKTRRTTKVGERGWSGEIVTMSSEGMLLQILGPWNSHGQENHRGRLPIKTSLVGRHNGYNLLGVIAGATAIGVDCVTVMRAIEDDKGVPGRLQAVVSPGKLRKEMAFQVFVDYAHTHDALENVLSALRATMERAERPPEGGTPNRLICVFGCGGDRDRTKRPKMGAVAERLADWVIVTSDNPRTEDAGRIIEEVCVGFSAGWREAGKIVVEADRRAAIQRAIGEAKKGDVVLIAGKGHENYQIVGTTKTHFDDVGEAAAAMRALK